jgi:hypothetical protein
VVRQNVGYARYDTPAELDILNQLYAVLRLYVNFFQPQMKLVSKTRRGAKVTKRLDQARTPYQPAVASPHMVRGAKATLTRTYLELNPAETGDRRVSGPAARDNRTKPDRRREVRRPGHPSLGEKFSWTEISRTSLVRQPMDPSRTS